MRLERKGPVARITPRLERFFQEALGGVPLDEVQHAEARKADFECLNGLLAIELKSLERDASARMNNLTDQLRQRPDWPIFLGSAPMQSFLEHMRESEDVKRSLIDRLGRAIKNHMRKANKQLEAHEAAFPRKNMVKVMVLANETMKSTTRRWSPTSFSTYLCVARMMSHFIRILMRSFISANATPVL